MNKTAIKNFAVWARNKLIADVRYRAGLLGITEKGINSALSQSVGGTEFYDIGTTEPYAISGSAIKQRRKLVEVIEQKAKETDYKTAYKYILEEVAYTWFNRLIAVRFMEVNDYLPSHVRVLSSESGKTEPDLVTDPFNADIPFNASEEAEIVKLKQDNLLDDVFRILFIKQCNALNDILPALFEKTSDYTELLLNISYIDKDGVVAHLVRDIDEADFDVNRGGQVEIIGWLYQYYNTEPKSEAFAKDGKITKDEIPAVTQLFTPDWIVRYMVENSLGRLWLEGHPNEQLRNAWEYYLDEAEQEPAVESKLAEIRAEHAKLNPEDIKLIDPCMGSGHILVYAFDVLMQIYESAGWSQRDAAKSILENNIYGLDIDDRAGQMAYFAIMMKARQYNRRILNADTSYHVYAIQESNGINRNQLQYFGTGLSEFEKNSAINQMLGLLDTFVDAKEYGSILNVDNYDWILLKRFLVSVSVADQMSFDTIGIDETRAKLIKIVNIAEVMSSKYEITITNPPYMANGGFSRSLDNYVKKYYSEAKTDLYAVFILKCSEMTKANAYQAMITQHSWMFISSFEKLRNIIIQADVANMVHLGPRAFEEIAGEVVQTATFVLRNCHNVDYKGKFIRLVQYNSEIEKRDHFFTESVYQCSKRTFSFFPGNQYVYWVGDNVIKCFNDYPILDDKYTFREGIHTADNARFLRAWFEVDFSKIVFDAKSEDDIDSHGRWVPYNKGGRFRKWYGNGEYLIGFDKEYRTQMSLLEGHVRPSQDLYFKKGGTWTAVASGKLGVRYYPEGYLFDAGGQIVVGENIESVIALLNTKVYNAFADMLMPTLNYKCGMLKKLPNLILVDSEIDELAKENIELSRQDWDSYEISWNFRKHPLIEQHCFTLEDAMALWKIQTTERFARVFNNERIINRKYLEYYQLSDEILEDIEEKDITISLANESDDIKSFISYAVGCMFGRYSLEQDGVISDDLVANEQYEFITSDNIIPITDEEYMSEDIVVRFCSFLKKVFGVETLEQNLEYIAKRLGNKGSTSREIIRNYFLSDFFKDHCNTYSVTGSGKRPIYWLFNSGKQNGFKALIYLHNYNPDTIGKIRVDYLHRLQRVYESEVARMQDLIDHSVNNREVNAAVKRKERLQKQLKECRDYDEKISHIALSRIELDLDAGVKFNYRRLQTSNDGIFHEILADSNAIMFDDIKYAEMKKHYV